MHIPTCTRSLSIYPYRHLYVSRCSFIEELQLKVAPVEGETTLKFHSVLKALAQRFVIVQRCSGKHGQLVLQPGAGLDAASDAQPDISVLEAARKLGFAYRRHMVQKRVRLRKLQRELGIEEWRRNHVIVQCSSTQLDALEGVGRSFSAV